MARGLVSADLLPDFDRAKIVVTNFHAFQRRQTTELSKVGRELLLQADAQGRGRKGGGDPLLLPSKLQTALHALYGHYEKTFNEWDRAGTPAGRSPS